MNIPSRIERGIEGTAWVQSDDTVPNGTVIGGKKSSRDYFAVTVVRMPNRNPGESGYGIELSVQCRWNSVVQSFAFLKQARTAERED